MSPWVALTGAVIANAIANVAFKFAIKQASSGPSGYVALRFLTQPTAWIGLLAAIILLASYVVAIRELGLGFCYAIVTSAALILVTMSGALAFHERLSTSTFLGIGFVMLGIAVLTSSQTLN